MKKLERFDIVFFVAEKDGGLWVNAEKALDSIDGWQQAFRVLRDEVRRLRGLSRDPQKVVADSDVIYAALARIVAGEDFENVADDYGLKKWTFSLVHSKLADLKELVKYYRRCGND